MTSSSGLLVVFLHHMGTADNLPLLFIVVVGVVIGLFLAWRRR